jgi:hypothetical protein
MFGNRREIRPEASVYNRVLDLDWNGPSGYCEFCGGDALIRRSALELVGGYDDNLIAGEEPDLCTRLRMRGHLVLHLDIPMTRHDLAITRLAGYWRRSVRTGHAYAQIAHRFFRTAIPLWRSTSLRNLVIGAIYTAIGLFAIPLFFVQPRLVLPFLAVAALVLLRTAYRARHKTPSFNTLAWYAFHSHFQQIPIFFGQVAYWRRHRLHKSDEIIEYK